VALCLVKQSTYLGKKTTNRLLNTTHTLTHAAKAIVQPFEMRRQRRQFRRERRLT
jgi:hypothetical protein